MKNTKKYTGNKRVLDVPSVLNEVEYVDGVPIGMTEDAASTKSANFGTPRDSIKAGALVGNNSARVVVEKPTATTLPDNFKISGNIVLKNNISNQTIVGFGYDSDSYCKYSVLYTSSGLSFSIRDTEVTYDYLLSPPFSVDDLIHFDIEIYNGFLHSTVNGVEAAPISIQSITQTPSVYYISLMSRGIVAPRNVVRDGSYIFDIGIDELDSQGNYIQTLAHYKTQEGSGNTVYDSSGNGNHGTIINPYEGMWGEHNGYSYADEEGFNQGGNLLKYSGDLVTTGWSYLNVSVSGGELDIDGELKAFRITSTNSNLAEHALRQVTAHSGDKWETSILVKIGSGFDEVYIRDTYSAAFASFNLTTGTVLLEIDASAIIEDKGNGWYKISIIALEDTVLFDSINFGLGLNISSAVPLGEYVIVCRPQSKIVGSNYEYINTEASSIIDVALLKDDSISLPPFKDVLGNNLQYIGKVPSKAEYVESPCFEGDGSGYLVGSTVTLNQIVNFDLSFTIDYTYQSGVTEVILNNRDSSGGFQVRIFGTGDGISVFYWFPSAATFDSDYVMTDGIHKVRILMIDGTCEFYVDDNLVATRLADTSTVDISDTNIHLGASLSNVGDYLGTSFSSSVSIWDVKWKELNSSGVEIGDVLYWPLIEPIKDFANHTYHDVVGGNHASLVNGSFDNEGVQDVFHYGELGYSEGRRFQNSIEAITYDNKLDVSGVTNMEFNCTFTPDIADTFDYLFSEGGIGTFALANNRLRFGSLEGNLYGNDPSFQAGVFYKVRISVDLGGNMKSWVNDVLLSDISIGTDTFKNIGLFIGALAGIGNQWYGTIHSLDIKLDGEVVFKPNLITGEDSFSGFSPTIIGDVTPVVTPASAVNPTEDALGNPLTVTQDGKSFLGTCKMKHVEMGRVIEADDGLGFWFTPTGVANTKELTDFTGVIGDQLLSDGGSNIRTHKKALVGRQLLTEKKITNN